MYRPNLYFIAAVLMLIPCCNADTPKGIYGVVLDASNGTPLEEVTVRISGSTFLSKTDSQGRYDIDYVPGNFAVQYTMRGYLPCVLPLSIAQKFPFPAQGVSLIRLPVPVNWLGEVLSHSTVTVQRLESFDGSGEPLSSPLPVDESGAYQLPVVEGDAEVVISAEGCRAVKFPINIAQQKAPRANQLVLMPADFGLYLGTQPLVKVKVHFAETPVAQYQGGFAIPRIPGTWEGKYYARGPRNRIQVDGDTLSLYFYPDLPSTIGFGPSPLSGTNRVAVLRPQADGLLAFYGPERGDYDEVKCSIETILKRGGDFALVYKQHNLYKVTVPVRGESTLVLTDWVKNAFEPLFHPGEGAWILDIHRSGDAAEGGKGPYLLDVVGGPETTLNTLVEEADQPDSAVRGALYYGRFRDNGDGTITDEMSGLMWWKEDRCELTWQDAMKAVVESTLGGYTDWRMPSRTELLEFRTTLLNTAQTLDRPKPFVWNSLGKNIWSSTLGPRPTDARQALGNWYFRIGVLETQKEIQGYEMIDYAVSENAKGCVRARRDSR